MNNGSTAAQRRYIESLAKKCGEDVFNAAFAAAARINQNKPRADWETINQACARLSKKAASSLIESLNNPAPPQPAPSARETGKMPIFCPECGSTDLGANTWESWCFDCDARWVENPKFAGDGYELNPELYSMIRKEDLMCRPLN